MGPDRRPEAGRIPQPRFIDELDGLQDYHGRYRRWMGIDGLTIEGKPQTFVFYRSVPLVDELTSEAGSDQAASLLALLKIAYKVDAAIGLPLDPWESAPFLDYIKIDEDPKKVGIYVDPNVRVGFTLHGQNRASKDVIETIEENPDYHTAIENAKTILPKPNPLIDL